MMSKTYSLKCTNCASPLTLLGGGRVESITCSYCKSILDLNDNYKVLSNFKNLKEKQALPFQIGMKGELKGVEYTMIGRVTYQELEPPFEEWSEFLLFSSLYGYAWLTYEQGHLLFSKRNRTFPSLSWDDTYFAQNIAVEGHNYKAFSHYTAQIIYVEGELTWVAKKHDKVSFIDFIEAPYGLSAEKSKSEIEYYSTEYLDADEVYTAFSVPKEKQESPRGFNPLKPFSKPFFQSLSKVSIWAFMVTLFLMMAVYFDGQGEILTHFEVTNKSQTKESFVLKNTTYLTAIELSSPSSKSLDSFNIKLYKDTQLVFSANSHNAYIFEKKTQKIEKVLEKWEEKATKVKIYLNLDEVGAYELLIDPVSKEGNSRLKVTVKQGVSRMNYLVLFSILAFVLSLLYYYFKWRYDVKIRSESDVYDDTKGVAGYDIWIPYIFWFVMIVLIIFFGE
jgi:hypothetical protein